MALSTQRSTLRLARLRHGSRCSKVKTKIQRRKPQMARTFRFVHTADLHLDSEFAGLTKISPEIRGVLQDATLDAFDAVVRRTIESDAAFLLIAGDIYDGADRGIRAQLRFRDRLDDLSRRGVQTFIVHGNHDPLEGWSAISRWPDGVTVFPHGRVDAVHVERQGTRLATVHGISFGERREPVNLALRFPPAEDSGFHIGLLHCNLGREEHPSYSPTSLSDLERASYSYWALGHLHKREVVRSQDPTVVYPGNPQALSFKSSELEPKGAYLVEVEDGRIANLDFFETDRARFQTLTLRIDELEDAGELQDQLRAAARERVAVAGDRTVLLAATLEGHGPVSSLLARPGAREDLLEALRALDAGEPTVWWARLEDATMPEIDPGTVAQRDDFHGAVARFGARLSSNRAELSAFLHRHAKGPAKAALLDEENLSTFLDRSVIMALETLGAPEDDA